MTEYKTYSDIKQFNCLSNKQIYSLDLSFCTKIVLNNPAFYRNYLILKQDITGLLWASQQFFF
jgi:hypothetical protein